jgi:microcin C transport system ATP-binding protein
MSFLKVSDLSVRFHLIREEVDAVRGVSFHIDRGEVFSLVGESGAGKSVTALSIMRLLPPDKTTFPTGRIEFEGRELLAAPGEVMRDIRGDRISMIFQEPMTSLNPLHTVAKQVGEAMTLHRRVGQEETRRRTVDLLKMVQLQDAESRLDSYPHQLSGGQRQRVMIAMALANEPDLLIADEPTTALDVTIQAEILCLLRDLQKRFDMSLLLITHDLEIVRKITDRVAVMKDGKIVETGPIERVFEEPRHEYTRYLIDSELYERAHPVPGRADTVLESGGLSVAFPVYRGVFRRQRGEVRAVNDVSLTIRAGQTVGLVGESGSGKTTFGLAVLRLVPSTGSIRFDGRELQGLKSTVLRPYREEMQIIFQDPFASLNPRFTVGQIVEEGLRVHHAGSSRQERKARIDRALAEVGLEPAASDRYPHEFSGGERQRICIARALILKPRFLVLDEPTSSLDMSVQTQIIHLLKEIQEKYRLAYLFISHDLRVVRAISHEIIVLKDGDVVERGPAERVFTDPRDPYTRALIRAAVDIDVCEDGES